MSFSENVIAIINELCSKFGVAIDWTAQNVIPYLTELCGKYIKWEISTSVLWMVCITLIVIILSIITILLCKKAKAQDWDFDYEHFPIFAVISMVALFFAIVCWFFVVCEESIDIITCVTFPEKAIMEYASNLLNS